MKLHELATLLGGRLCGDGEVEVTGIAQVDDVREDEITFVDDTRYLAAVADRTPAAVLVSEEIPDLNLTQIIVPEPRLAAMQAAAVFVPEPTFAPGVDTGALCDASATIDPTATVMAGAYVGPRAQVGARSVIMPQVYVGADAVVGADCRLHSGTRVGDRCRLGDRVICHFNVAIGGDGYGYFRSADEHVKIPQKGIAVIEDDVEIGANSCVDRATFGRTVVGAGTKIDNLVQVAHNCLIGKRCLLIAQVGLAGSVVVGDDTILAGRVAVVPHGRIGKGCVVGPLSGVTKDLPDGSVVAGMPAKNHMDWKRELAALTKMPTALKTLKRLERRVDELEGK
ncbi:MAG: UDP-3-O-(3-hydroxymyristoyl)glucosamine N-acyltransferase [Candidatus Lernaella stagnicola]|nr:UDP-3-O-(3-hydroxymyristoyl)glucosamine N-acyltransferase [Candidatus Lernaella stagnicola]